jgi:putative transposase
MTFAFVRDNRKTFDVHVMCSVFGVTPAGFYAWCRRKPSARAVRATQLAVKVHEVHRQTKGVYGSLKITKELRQRNTIVNRKTVARIMKQLGIRSKTRKVFRVQTTDSRHTNAIASNVLDQNFASITSQDQAWGVDITYIFTGEGVLYLAGVMDLWSRRIIGWSMSDTMTTRLVEDALRAAVQCRNGKAQDVLHHSDRGVQYTSMSYRAKLEELGMQPSMSRKGNCYDNAMVESFWGKLKTECVHHERFATHAHAKAAVFEYIEMFYNRQRLHASLDYKSPVEYEASVKSEAVLNGGMER